MTATSCSSGDVSEEIVKRDNLVDVKIVVNRTAGNGGGASDAEKTDDTVFNADDAGEKFSDAKLIGSAFSSARNQAGGFSGASDAKVISSTYPADTKEYYQYKALYKDSGTGIQGETNEWTDFANGRTVGYFSKGRWEFSVRIICGNKTSYGVLYTGTKTVDLKDGYNTVNMDLSSVVPLSGEGYVSFNISVPDAFSTKGTIRVFTDNKELSLINVYQSASGSGSLYSGSFKCSAGYKNIRFEYWDLGASAASAVSSQLVNVRVVENTTVSVEGSLLSANYVGADVKVEYKSLSATVTGKTPIELGQSLNYICNVTGGGGEGYHYQWYLNGLPLEPIDSSVYPMYWHNLGFFSLTCVVWCADEGQRIYTSSTLEVEVVK